MSRTPVLALVFALAAHAPAAAQCPPQAVSHPFPQAGDLLGESCALDGDLLVLGGSQISTGQGRAAVFRNEGGLWVFEDDLDPSPFHGGEAFGFTCALDGDTAIVASDGTTGTCFDCLSFFERRFDGFGVPFWERTAGFPVAIPRVDGKNVALFGDVAVAGRGYTSDDVLVYRRSSGTWGTHQLIFPPSGHGSASFGDEVALKGKLLVVSGGGRTYVYRDSGTQFVFESELLDAFGGPVGGLVGVLDTFPLEYAAVATTSGVHVFSSAPQPFPFPPLWGQNEFVPHPAGTVPLLNQIEFSFDVSLGLFQTLRMAIVDRQAYGGEGVIWILERGATWNVRQAIVQPGVQHFGFDVDLDGARLATSTWTVDGASIDEGGGWVYELSSARCATACRAPRLPDDHVGSGDELGATVEIHGDLAFVGSPRDDTLASNAGAVHVYRRFGSCWSLEQTLFASDAGIGDLFGASLDVSQYGSRLIVGAPRSNNVEVDSGSAYVFEDIGGGVFVETAALRANTEIPVGIFGQSVAIDFSFAVVGATGASAAANDRAYVFQQLGSSWVLVQELLPDTSGVSYAGFGKSVDITDCSLVVGSDWDADSGFRAGAVYHYVGNPFTAFSFTEKLTAPVGTGVDVFGGAVALQHSPSGGDLLVVGARGAEDGTIRNAGQVYVYDNVGFGSTLLRTLGAPAPEVGARFGSSVDLDGFRFVVGAKHDDGAGSAYSYGVVPPFLVELEGAIHGSPLNVTSDFGADVAVDDTVILIGAPEAQGATLLDTGAAWFHELEDFQTPSFVRRLSF